MDASQKRLGMWLDGLMPESERDGYRTSGQKHQDELAVMAALAEAQKQVAKWKRIRTPTHGPCCTCQACGLDYDECRCSLDDVVDENEQCRQEGRSLTYTGRLAVSYDFTWSVAAGNRERSCCHNPPYIGRNWPLTKRS